MEGPRVFVSYRRDDSPQMTGRIRDRLVREFGEESVFIDVESVGPSRDFREDIHKAVSGCDVMLVVIGPNWLRSVGGLGLRQPDWVVAEVEMGLRSTSIAVLPILVGDTTMPEASEMPEVIGDLAYLQAARVRNDPDFHPDVDRLLTRPPFGSGEKAKLGSRGWAKQSGLRQARFAAVGIAAVLIAGAAWLLSTRGEEAPAELTTPALDPDVASVATSTPTQLSVSVNESSIAVDEDRTQRSNLGLMPDGSNDLSFEVSVTGAPTGIIVTICEDEFNHSTNQWDTYTGAPPDDEPPFAGRPPHELPTYQLAVVGEVRTQNPDVDLDQPLPDGVYELFIPLFNQQSFEGGLCVTVVSGSGDDVKYSTAFVAPSALPW